MYPEVHHDNHCYCFNDISQKYVTCLLQLTALNSNPVFRKTANDVTMDRFYVNDVPIRGFVSPAEVGLHFPSRPRRAYSIIRDVSTWAYVGVGPDPVDYSHAPVDATHTNFNLDGCAGWDPMVQSTPPDCAMPNHRDWFTDRNMQENLSHEDKVASNGAQMSYMGYSYSNDVLGHSLQTSAPECLKQGQHPKCILLDVAFWWR